MEPIKQQVVVGQGGEIVIRVPQLPPGTLAEVTVVETPASGAREGCPGPRARLIGSCPGMFASPAEVDAFLSRERDAWQS